MSGARTHDEDAAPAERATPAVTGLREAVDAAVAVGRGAKLVPSHVLALQRAWGNRAVANTLGRGVLARQEAAVDTPETAYADAVAHSTWDAAARALAAMDDAGRRQHVASAPTSQLMSIAAAAEAANLPAVRNAVATVLTQPARAAEAAQINHDKAFADALAIPNWDQVAQALSAYDDAGMDAKLATMHLEQLNETSAAAGRAGAGMQRVREHAETARVRKLGQEWDSAYQHGNWERAVTLVQSYNDADLPGRLGALNYDQLVALKAQAGRMPSYARVAGFAEPVRVSTLGREYEAAVNA
ncbi:MAG: hypothetical protein JWN32_310, partial [Solirubrobacterales bacterium]|nr:hypothetical protein [Solirubrobacterales bacterium]